VTGNLPERPRMAWWWPAGAAVFGLVLQVCAVYWISRGTPFESRGSASSLGWWAAVMVVFAVALAKLPGALRRTADSSRRRTLVGITAAAAILAVMLQVILLPLAHQWRFSAQRQRRERVALAALAAARSKTPARETIALSEPDRDLALGGAVSVLSDGDFQGVFFLTNDSDYPADYLGYIYAPDASAIPGSLIEGATPMADHWWYGSLSVP
jgi:hypothetical protein